MSILIDEKTKKEREERAKSLISQRSISDSINTVNYAKMKNINLNPQSDEEKNFISKVDRANSLISSINPREDIPEPVATDEQKAQSKENIKYFLDLIDKNRNDNTINDISEQDISQNTQNNQAENSKTKSTVEITMNPEGERIIKRAEAMHQNELKKAEVTPLINKKISDNSNIKVDQNISSNINQAENDTNNMVKNGEISIASKNDTNNLKTYTDYKLQQQKNEKDNSNIFEKSATWFKDIVGSIGVSISSVISRNRKNYQRGN